jgi:hypothetical protein
MKLVMNKLRLSLLASRTSREGCEMQRVGEEGVGNTVELGGMGRVLGNVTDLTEM